MCLKPHFICLPLAATLLNCLQDRSFRPIFSASNLVFLGMGLAYVGFVQVVHPAYFSTIVGLALEVYGAYGSSFGKNFQIIGYPLGLFALILFVGLRSKQMTRSAAAFTALAFGGLGSYFLQGTGFSYHKVPFIAFATIAGCLIILKPSRPGLDLIPAAIGLVGLAATGGATGVLPQHDRSCNRYDGTGSGTHRRHDYPDQQHAHRPSHSHVAGCGLGQQLPGKLAGSWRDKPTCEYGLRQGARNLWTLTGLLPPATGRQTSATSTD
jgi:hypothetical protein